MTRNTVFDYHDCIAGHVTLTEDDKYYHLYVGHRDMQFSKETGQCVGGGSKLGGPANRYCLECQQAPPPDTENAEPPPDWPTPPPRSSA